MKREAKVLSFGEDLGEAKRLNKQQTTNTN